MKISDRAIAIYKSADSLREDAQVKLTEMEVAICSAVEERLQALEGENKRLRSRLSRQESRGEYA